MCANLMLEYETSSLFPAGVDWGKVPEETPPKLLPYLPSNTKGEQGLHSDYNVRDESDITSLIVQSTSYLHDCFLRLVTPGVSRILRIVSCSVLD